MVSRIKYNLWFFKYEKDGITEKNQIYVCIYAYTHICECLGGQENPHTTKTCQGSSERHRTCHDKCITSANKRYWKKGREADWM
jgi:hypothetical protein